MALVDLDVQFGDSATALGLAPEHTIGQLATMPAIDSTTLKVFLTPHEASGAFVLCGSDSPEEGEAVTDEHAGRIVELLADDFAYVVVDTPAGLDERTLAALEHATDVVLRHEHGRVEHPQHGQGDRRARPARPAGRRAATSCSTGPTPASASRWPTSRPRWA